MKRNWHFEAGRVWPMLVAHAAGAQTCWYEDIARVIDTNPLSVRFVLGPIQSFCMVEQLPPLTALILQKGRNKPGTGFIAWDVDDLEEAHRRVFAFDWRAIPNPFSRLSPSDDLDSLAQQLVSAPSQSGQVYAKVPSRGVAQVVFRAALLKTYRSCCAFCGLSFPGALDAAHIWPWAKSSPSERLDPANGVLVCATHHRLFDSDLLTFDENYTAVYCDPDGEDGPYSEADTAASIALNGRSLLIPERVEHQPNRELLGRRNAAAEWGDLAAYRRPSLAFT